MRVKVEFETDAWLINGHWNTVIPNQSGPNMTAQLAYQYATPIGADEPTIPGHYKVTYVSGVKAIVNLSLNDWYIIGSSRPNTWQELGNIIAVERIEL